MGGLKLAEGIRMGVWGLLPRKISESTPFLEAGKWLLWKQYYHVHPILVLKIPSKNLKEDDHENILKSLEERINNFENHEDCVQFWVF